MAKILAERGGIYFLIDAGEADGIPQARVFDMGEKAYAGPAEGVDSIVARGYWETDIDPFVKSLVSDAVDAL